MKILKFLILANIFLLIFGEVARFEIGNNIAVKPLDVSVLFTLAVYIFTKTKRINLKKITKNREKFLKKNLKFILFPAIGLFSLLLNLSWLTVNEFFVSSLYLIRWIAYLSLFFIISDPAFSLRNKISSIMLYTGAIVLFIGFLQFFFFNSLRSLYDLGWDDHMHRMFTIFLDPNFAGAFFVLYFIFLLGLLFERTNSKKLKMIFIILLLLLSLIAIFLTFSRSAIIMLIVSSATFLFLINKKKLILYLFAIIITFILIASPKFYDENMNLFRVNSSQARIHNYEIAISIIQEHPLLGVGFNSYRYTKRLYDLDHEWVDAPSHADAGVDNSFLFVLSTTGILGLVSYLYLWLNLITIAWGRYGRNKSMISIVAISSISGLFVDSLFINSLFYSFLMLWIWVLFGLSLEKR